MKKIILAMLLFFPVSAFACSYTATVTATKPTCTIITEQQIVSNAQQEAGKKAGVDWNNYPNPNSPSDNSLIPTLQFLYSNYYQTSEATNNSCKSDWDIYNQQISTYNACIANQNFTAPTPTPTPIPSVMPILMPLVSTSVPQSFLQMPANFLQMPIVKVLSATTKKVVKKKIIKKK